MIKRTAFACIVLTFLSSCGYRGALYLPEQAPNNTSENNAPSAPSQDEGS